LARRWRVNEPPLGQELATRHGLGVARQLLGVELLGDPVRLQQAGPSADLLAWAGTALVVLDSDPGLVGEPLDGLAEVEVVDPLDERDRVAALAAPEAVPDTKDWPHVERRGLLVVEGAQALQ